MNGDKMTEHYKGPFREDLIKERIVEALDLVAECNETGKDESKSKKDLQQSCKKAIVALVHCIDLQSELINEIVTAQQQLALHYADESRIIS